MAIDFDQSVKQTVLPNGVTVITDYYDRDDSDVFKDVLCAEIIVHTGSLHDPVDKNGLTHFAEHMIAHAHPDFKGFRDLTLFQENLGNVQSNMRTGLQYTTYWAKGTESGVVKYIDMIAQSIHALDYTDAQLEYERPIIINEIKGNLTKRDRLHGAQRLKSLFGPQAHAQWLGGYPRYLEAMTKDDIRNYHTRTHTTGNIVFITSGAWTHEQACAWANDNLDNLPVGPRTPTLKSLLLATNGTFIDPHLSNDETSDMVDYDVIYDRSILSPRASQALGIMADVITNRINQTDGLYDLRAQFNTFGNTRAITIEGSKIEATQLHNKLFGALNRIKTVIGDMTADDFYRQRDKSVEATTSDFKRGGSNPFARSTMMVGEYLSSGDLFAEMTRRRTVSKLTLDEGMEAVMSVMRQRPSTFYALPRSAPCPTGEELQNVWFSGSPAPGQ